jgi:hypothetical protein
MGFREREDAVAKGSLLIAIIVYGIGSAIIVLGPVLGIVSFGFVPIAIMLAVCTILTRVIKEFRINRRAAREQPSAKK